MGDRTYCNLVLGGLLDKRHIGDLVEIFDNLYVSDGKPKKDLPKGKGSFGFEEVNYAELDDTLRDKLIEAKLSYAWFWAAGGDYGPGVNLYDARTGKHFDFSTSGDEIVLTLSECEDPAKLAEAKAANVLWANLKLATFESRHDLIALAAEKDWVTSYLPLIEGALTVDLAS